MIGLRLNGDVTNHELLEITSVNIYSQSPVLTPPPPCDWPAERFHLHNSAPADRRANGQCFPPAAILIWDHSSELTWIFNTPTTWAVDWPMVSFHSDLQRPFLCDTTNRTGQDRIGLEWRTHKIALWYQRCRLSTDAAPRIWIIQNGRPISNFVMCPVLSIISLIGTWPP